MANSILEIIIRTIKQGTGFQDTERETKSFQRGLDGVNKALGAFGLALGAKEAVDFAMATRDAAMELNNAENALTQVVGSTRAYNQAIADVREATRNTVSETEAARSAFGLLDNGIAKTATEAANYVRAGKALESALGAETASYEKFLMLLDQGSPMLLNNFNLTDSMVEAREKLIEKTTNLRGAEANLQAVRELALEKGLALADTISQETIQAQQATAAFNDFSAAFGQLVIVLDRATGITPFFTATMQKLTEGAQAWSFVFNEAIPAIEAHQSALAADAVQAVMTGQSYDEVAEAVRRGSEDIEAFKNSLLSNVDTHEEYQAVVDKVAESNIFMAGQLDLTAEQFQALRGNAMAAAEAMRGMHIVTSDAAIAFLQAADAQSELNKALAEQQRLDLSPQTNRQRDAYAQYYSAVGSQTQLLGDFQRQEEERKRQEAEQTAKEQEQSAKRAAQETARAFEKAADDIGNVIGSKLQTTFQEVFQLPDTSEHADEPARRLATVAASGFGSEWLTQLNQQFAGAAFWQPIANAIASGDEGQLKAAATGALQQFSQGLITDLFDVNLIRNQVRAEMTQKRLKEQVIEEVRAGLGSEGISQAIGVVQVAAGDVGAATAQVESNVSTMAATTGTAGDQIKTSFDGSRQSVDTLILRIQELNKTLERTKVLAGEAGSGIAGLNPPNAAPTTAQSKVGGQTRL